MKIEKYLLYDSKKMLFIGMDVESDDYPFLTKSLNNVKFFKSKEEADKLLKKFSTNINKHWILKEVNIKDILW